MKDRTLSAQAQEIAATALGNQSVPNRRQLERAAAVRREIDRKARTPLPQEHRVKVSRTSTSARRSKKT